MRSQQRVLDKRSWIKLVTGVMTILMGSGGLRAGEYRITASGSGPIYGYGGGGTIVPGTAYKTYTITKALWSGLSSNFIFSLSGTVAPPTNAFVSLTLNGVTYLASAGSYSTSSNVSTWSWTIASNPFPSGIPTSMFLV